MANPVYFVECRYGRLGNAFRETDRDSNSLKAIVELIRTGEIDPIKILEVDEDAGRVENITDEVMSLIPRSDDYRTPYSVQNAIDWQNDRKRAEETV